MPPTWVTLHDLVEHTTVASALAAAHAVVPRWYRTRPSELDGERVALFDGDAGFDDGDASRAGPRHRLTLHRGAAWVFERTPARATISEQTETPA